MDLDQYLQENEEQIDKFIHRHFGSATGGLSLASAHLLVAGGKRLRPAVLTLAAGAIKKGAGADVLPAALALELTHTFTLIHDDIMDGDTLRRGVPTVHTKWGNPTAILAGDVLFASAFEFLCLADASPESKVRAISILAKASVEICQGQFLDMSFETRDDVTDGEYLEMVRKKTGVLYAAAAAIGGTLAGGSSRVVDALTNYGIYTGMAFQIQDDLIDIIADAGESGKDRGSDIREGKQTLISIRAKEAGIDLAPYRNCSDPKEMDALLTTLKKSGVINSVLATASDLVANGNRRLNTLPMSEERELLKAIGEFFISRGA
ncbi:MAG: polyprenyl synthetase family protein [Methanomicrobiales archaeon]|nr:polyprenyl synthetase family protein [Methanomicrobiales archaeon]